MRKAPTWGQLREMLGELSKTNGEFHDQLHPLYEQVGENRSQLDAPVQDWARVEEALLKLLGEMQVTVEAHLQINALQCSPSRSATATAPPAKVTRARRAAKKGGR